MSNKELKKYRVGFKLRNNPSNHLEYNQVWAYNKTEAKEQVISEVGDAYVAKFCERIK